MEHNAKDVNSEEAPSVSKLSDMAEVAVSGGLCLIGVSDENLDHDTHAHRVETLIVEIRENSSGKHRLTVEPGNYHRESEDNMATNNGTFADTTHCEADRPGWHTDMATKGGKVPNGHIIVPRYNTKNSKASPDKIGIPIKPRDTV